MNYFNVTVPNQVPRKDGKKVDPHDSQKGFSSEG